MFAPKNTPGRSVRDIGGEQPYSGRDERSDGHRPAALGQRRPAPDRRVVRPPGDDRHLEGAGRRTGRGQGLQPGRRRTGGPPAPWRLRQGGLRLRGRGLPVVVRRARPGPGPGDLRREPDHRGDRPGGGGRRRALVGGLGHPRGQRTPAPVPQAGDTHGRLVVRRRASTRRRASAPTCASWARGNWRRETKSAASLGPPERLTIGDLVEAHHDPTPELLARIAASPDVPEKWRAMAQRKIRRQQAR